MRFTDDDEDAGSETENDKHYDYYPKPTACEKCGEAFPSRNKCFKHVYENSCTPLKLSMALRPVPDASAATTPLTSSTPTENLAGALEIVAAQPKAESPAVSNEVPSCIA